MKRTKMGTTHRPVKFKPKDVSYAVQNLSFRLKRPDRIFSCEVRKFENSLAMRKKTRMFRARRNRANAETNCCCCRLAPRRDAPSALHCA